jgi:hypothetical protein
VPEELRLIGHWKPPEDREVALMRISMLPGIAGSANPGAATGLKAKDHCRIGVS